MSDLNPTTGIQLGDALRALPLCAPLRDDWPALAAQLAPPTPLRPRYAVPLSIAAVCLLAILAATALNRSIRLDGPQLVATGAPTKTPSTTNSSTVEKMTNVTNVPNWENTHVQLAAAQTRSQALEHWLHETRGAASPLPSQDLAAAAEIENLIGLVDVELAFERTNALPLWQRRVALLEDLTALRYSNDRLAESAPTSTTIDTLHRIN